MNDDPTDKLARLLSPRVVAVVGASNFPGRIGGRPLNYLKNHGYGGTIIPVNPTRETVQGLPSVPSVSDIDGQIDTAIIAVPAAKVLQTLRDCAAKGASGCIIFSSGFAEMDEDGVAAQEELSTFARQSGMRLIGPNCLGVYNAHQNFFATFSGTIELKTPTPGGLSIISQSGAFGAHLSHLAALSRLGMRYLVTTGNECDVQVADAIRLCALDPESRVILAYSEGIKDGEKLIDSLEMAAAAEKPVIFMKVGRSDVGTLAASSHTASLTGEDAVIDAIFRQYGVHRASTTEETLDIAYGALYGTLPKGRRLGLITLSGGVGVLMADAAQDHGLDVAPMSEEAQASLKALLPFSAPRNPVDVTAHVLNQLELFPKFFSTMLSDGNYDSCLAFFTTTAEAERTAGPLLEAMREISQSHPDAFIALSLLARDEVKARYENLGLPVYEDPSRAVAAIAALTKFLESFKRLAGREKMIPRAARGLPDGTLNEATAKAILKEAGLPVLAETLANSARAAVAAAGNEPVAMKVVSADVPHKSEMGGVLLDVRGADAVGAAYQTLVERFDQHYPDATLDGILVSPMITGGVETILGVSRDPVFGPVVMLGLGGVLVEVLNDVTFRSAPFDKAEALMMIGELRANAVLDGVRGAPPADREALAQALSDLSMFAASEAQSVESIDINPFVVREKGRGCVALDALIVRRAL